MKKTSLWIMAAVTAFALHGCDSMAEAAPFVSQNRGSAKESDREPPFEIVETQEPEAESHILIAYFTWAENTEVEHPETVDVDATSSASVLLPGNTARLAGWIQEETGGDLFSIVTAQPYPSDYDECLDRGAKEQAEDARPELKAAVKNIDQYDVIFLGFPDWWGTCPMAVFSFLESYDFTGKTVIPFCSHGTSGVGRSIRDLKEAVPRGEILEEIGIYRQDTEEARPEIQKWVRELNVMK